MSFALLIIGITLVVAAVRGTHLELIALVKGDFSGPGNFWYWIAALLALGALGYIPRLKFLSDGLILIVVLALILSRGNPQAPAGGFFQQFLDAIGGTAVKTPSTIGGGGSTSGDPSNPSNFPSGMSASEAAVYNTPIGGRLPDGGTVSRDPNNPNGKIVTYPGGGKAVYNF